MKAFPAPALWGGSFLSGQNGLNGSRGGGLSYVQYFSISSPLQIFASMKSLNIEHFGIFKYWNWHGGGA